MTCLILLRALEVFTSASQSLLGRWPVCVRISTTSPFFSAVLQRHDAAVHLRAHAGVADVAVNRVREIDRRRLARQHDHLAHGREGVNFLRVQIHLERGHELARIAHLLLPLHQLAQPGDALIVGARPFAAFFIFPVRRDAFFRQAMHLLGADLHFKRPAARPDHRRVQRLIQVGAGNRDEVLDAARNRMPFVVNHAQRRVAVLHRIGDDAQRQQIVHLIERDLLPLHLLEHRVGALDAAPPRAPEYFSRRRFTSTSCRILLRNSSFCGALRLDLAHQFGRRFRLQIRNDKILQLAADFAHPQAVRDGRVNLERLLRDAQLPLARQRSPACACCAAGPPASR